MANFAVSSADAWGEAILTLLASHPMHGHKVTQSLIESIPMPLLVVNGQMRVSFVSRDFLAFYDLCGAQLENRNVAEIGGEPFALRSFQEALARLGSGKTDLEEFGSIHRGRAVVVKAQRITCDEIDQVLITARDITAEKDGPRILDHALKEAEGALRTSREELRALTSRLLNAQDEERRRISRELHDSLSQNIVALAFQVEELADKLEPRLRAETQWLAGLRNSIAKLGEDIRQAAHTLHPPMLDVLGLQAAIEASVSEFSHRTGVRTHFNASSVPAEIPAPVAESMYRIAQEALRNVARHAAYSTVFVSLRGTDVALTLSIQDNGPGFDREAVRGRGGLGLVSMEERARLIRARFELASAPGQGVAITISAPLPSASAASATS